MCCWQAVGNQSSGTTDCRKNAGLAARGWRSRAEQTVVAGWQVPPEQTQTGNLMRVEVVACGPKLAWEDHTMKAGKPAVPRQTCESPGAHASEGTPFMAATVERVEQRERKHSDILFSIYCRCFAFYPLKKQ